MKKIVFWILFACIAVSVIFIFACNFVVSNYSDNKLYDNVDSIPKRKVGLLPCLLLKNNDDKELFLNYIDAAEALYHARKIEYILVCGDTNSLDGYELMIDVCDSLRARDIEDAIFTDVKSFKLYDSVVRANKVYGQKSYTMISQQPINEKAIFLADHTGLETDSVNSIIAFNVKRSKQENVLKTYIHKCLTSVQMLIDIYINKKYEKINAEQTNVTQDEIVDMDQVYSDRCWREYWEIQYWRNHIAGHIEEEKIFGNFTGHGVDTLYVGGGYYDDATMTENYYLHSSNPRIPTLCIHGGCIVNEGDLDGNGTCEFGCLDMGHNSQWRTYNIYTLVNNEWRYLVQGSYLFIPHWVRVSGVEIAEPGKEKGTVLIHWCGESNALSGVICDTIVTPTFDKIEDE